MEYVLEKNWIPACAGMTVRISNKTSAFFSALIPTYIYSVFSDGLFPVKIKRPSG